MTTTNALDAKGTVWREDKSHPDGGYEVVATAHADWADEDQLSLHISRADGESGATFYLSPDQAKDLIVVIAAALADAP